MRFTVRTVRQEPALARVLRRFHGTGWPAFLRDDPVNAIWPGLYTVFPDFQFALIAASGQVVAIGNAIPFVWDGHAASLPDRIVDLLKRGFRDHRAGRSPNALSALAAIVDGRHQGQGWSGRVVSAMGRLARAHRLRALVAPVRPSMKGRYPLTPMEEYARWRDPAGAPFDPWLRVHWRLGARVLRIIPSGNTVRASVGEWEAWTGLRFPRSGRYIVPGAFQPIRVDRARDRVGYDEANVWMRHPVGGR
jgi:hypothetical protein